MISPRLVRYRDAPAYLGMDRNRFDSEVRPTLTVEARRGEHDKYVFTYAAPGHERERVDTMNSAAFQKARTDVGLPMVRMHDLRHTFGQRLRDAGVSEEDRALLLGQPPSPGWWKRPTA